VAEGLQDGLWETTDEVMGPADADWVGIDSHPQFAELAEDLEQPPARRHEEETRLDMNPLIDVTLVLLIFFILTTTYAALEKVLDAPGITPKDVEGPPKVTKEKVAEVMIKVTIRLENGKPVIRIEDEVADPENLVPALKNFVKSTRKTELLLDVGKGVDYGMAVMVQDAAKGADVDKVHYLLQEKPKK
jgi:biopolymer transport protein ExbD